MVNVTNGVWHISVTYADCQHLDKYKDYYSGQRAKPRKLRDVYFGPRGTITVGLAKQNTNPFFSVFRSAMEHGFYSAFRPYNDWTWCFSSAKAGYKLYMLPEEETADGVDAFGWEARHNGRARAFNDGRDYCIDAKLSPSLRSNNVTRRRKVEYWDDDDKQWKPLPDETEMVLVRTEADIPKWETEGWTYEYNTSYYGYHETLRKSGWKLDREPNGRLDRHESVTSWRQSWNLTQSDWDAVLLPVRQGGSSADEEMQGGSQIESHQKWMMSVRDGTKFYSYEPVWNNHKENFVYDLVNSTKWKTLDGGAAPAAGSKFGKMLAGGNHDPDPDGVWGANYGETSAKWNGWWDIASTAADHPANQREKVQCKWNIGKPNAELDWKKITNLMFH